MKIIDLSKTIEDNMPVYQGDPRVKIEIFNSHEEDGWELRKITMGSHTGSHVDAFSHMDRKGAKIDEISLDRFFGLSKLVSLDEPWKSNIGLFFTEEIGVEYLEKLLKSRPKFVGGNMDEALERALLNNEIITYTDLVNLDELRGYESFIFYGIPLKIKDGDGSPVRAFALIE